MLKSSHDREVLSKKKDCEMSGVQKIIVLGAFLLGAANAQQVVRSDAETGQKHVGCYYGVWAYTR